MRNALLENLLCVRRYSIVVQPAGGRRRPQQRSREAESVEGGDETTGDVRDWRRTHQPFEASTLQLRNTEIDQRFISWASAVRPPVAPPLLSRTVFSCFTDYSGMKHLVCSFQHEACRKGL
jgi:hypothetical protein